MTQKEYLEQNRSLMEKYADLRQQIIDEADERVKNLKANMEAAYTKAKEYRSLIEQTRRDQKASLQNVGRERERALTDLKLSICDEPWFGGK